MDQPVPPARDGFDVAIKILTIIKLLIEVAFWGICLAVTIWFMTHNPIPAMIDAMSKAISQGTQAAGSDAIKSYFGGH